MLSKFLRLFLWTLVFGLGVQNLLSQDIEPLKIEKDGLPAKPSFATQKAHSVYDYAKLLSPEERRMLETKISKYYDSTSTQIVIATIKKLNDDISLYATEWAHKWGIGQKDKGNGIFILVSKDDHKITIRTGYGVEHLLTDALSRRIIENEIIPYFRRGNFYKGLSNAVDAIIKVMKGAYKNDLPKEQDSGNYIFWIILGIIFLVFLLSIFSKGDNSGGGSWRSSGGGPIIFTDSGTSSWGGGSFGGGGGSWGGGFSGGFGGGGFGGGGATGGW